jgi:hypothetical protein
MGLVDCERGRWPRPARRNPQPDEPLLSSSEEYIFLRTVASSQSPWTEQLAVDPSFGYGIFSSHLAFCVHFLVSWATFQFT